MAMSFKEMCELEVGQTIYEYGYGQEIVSVVKTKPMIKYGQVSFISETDDGEEINYLMTKGYEHYCPKIYDYPVYSMIT